jgi:Beta/Gamma crystallin
MTIETAILVLAAAVFGSPSLVAQRSRDLPRDGACFYKDANYRGDFFCAEAGEDLSSMPSGANNEVSSIRIYGRVDIRVFEDSRYRGASLRVDSDLRDLQSEGFNDKISSIEIERRSGRGSSGGGRSGPANPELIIRRAYQDILRRDPDADGMRSYRSKIIDDGWTERDVREDLRRSAEYRDKTTMTREQAEGIVRRAYLSVLEREPDSESRGWVDRVLRDRWTQQDVERELRKSPEYRSRKPK